MSSASGLVALVALLGACASGTEPQPSPIAARRSGGDSLQPGVNVIVCAADAEGCVPTYAVACPASTADSVSGPPLGPRDQAWCAAGPRRDSLAPE
ncbi:MAG TPA: hypothetical protein VEB59_06880 [Gemmatimonadales bacterium]|nr:hypothetical protein [Gemmatimonadales bacterium]